MVDVTDETFESEVVLRSAEVPVVVDLWAPWCGPCRTLGPLLEQAVAATNGAVVLAKVNVDECRDIAASFQVQSIPAVYALRDGKVVDGFIGAQPESVVNEFVARLVAPPDPVDVLVEEAVAAGDRAGLERALEMRPDHPGAIAALAGLLTAGGSPEEAIAILGRIPETTETRRLLAEARLAARQVTAGDDELEPLLDALLARVRDDDEARQEFVDLLERLGPEDPRTAAYRKALAAHLF